MDQRFELLALRPVRADLRGRTDGGVAGAPEIDLQRDDLGLQLCDPGLEPGDLRIALVRGGPVGRWAQRTRLWGVIAAGNAGAMTLYLWHIVAIAIAAFGLNAFGLDAYDVHAGDFIGMLLLRAAVFAVVMLVLFRLLSPLERRPLPWWDAGVTVTGRRATAAGALVCFAGVVLVVMAKFGLGDPAGWTACAAFLTAASAARLFAAAPLRIRTATTLSS